MPEPPPIYRDLTADFPLRPDCRAQQWGRTVFLYHGGAYCAIVDLEDNAESSVEEVWRRCPPERWQLVSEWRPWE